MARLGTLYENTVARRFRAAIRPSLVGNLARIERDISVQAANALGIWLVQVVQQTLRTTKLNDRKGEVAKQLNAGIRVLGASSLNTLRGQIRTYPWLIAQEYGADITPTGGKKFLTVPIFYGLRPDGSPKFRSAASWRRFGSFVHTQRSTGKKFLAYRSKETGELRILYILLDEVEIKPVLGLIRNAGNMLDDLLSVWGQIYLAEATNPKYKIFDLWNGAY